jgi:hypothetical protein
MNKGELLRSLRRTLTVLRDHLGRRHIHVANRPLGCLSADMREDLVKKIMP